jgi:UDP-glucuronate 4-epimerase
LSRIVVTGGAGFIGSHLCEALLADSHQVIALDNFDSFYDPSIKRENLSWALQEKLFTLIEGDIRDERTVNDVLAPGVDAVVHLAALAGVRPSIEEPHRYADVNVMGTLALLEACRRNGVKKFVFGSSSSVYGDNDKVPFAESDPVDHPISPYAATKKSGELLCHTYHHLFGINVTCLRLFTVYGPRQRPDLAIHKFARLIESNDPIPVFGDGSMMRDFTYVDDIVSGIRSAIVAGSGYHLFNLGGSKPIALADLIEALEEALGKKAKIDRQTHQPGDVQRTYADIALARRDLGYVPKTDLRTGLTRFVEWFRKKND